MGSGASNKSNNSQTDPTVTKRGRKDTIPSAACNLSGPSQLIEVRLTKLGFSPAELTINEGQGILISWDGTTTGTCHNVKQVVLDNHTIHSVPGGYNSGDPKHDGTYTIDFILEGEYTFISDGFEAKSCKALVVTVRPRSAIIVQVTDDGFSQSILHISQGNTIKWTWNSTHRAHHVREVRLCPEHTSTIATETREPGLYFFQTEGEEQQQTHLCLVHVKESPRYYSIEVTDRKFHPQLLTVKAGDRVWWHWNKFKCKRQHRILEVELPAGINTSDPFPRPVRGGFSSDAPSRCGMLSHTFSKPGIYYYCDNNCEDNRDYLGVIIVLYREKEYHVEVTADGFYPDLIVVSAGDRIWWSWEIDKVQDVFSILQVESCTVGDAQHATDIQCNDFCQYLNEESAAIVTGIGMATVSLHTPGVFHYRISDTPISVGGCSAIVNPAQKDHTVLVRDNGFEPKVLTIRPGDRVWWVWENTKIQHNIVQVSAQGHPVSNGFCSGLPMDSPAAFMTQFDKLESIYFNSSGLPNLYGAIVVANQSHVHQVLVADNQLQPDPVLAQTNDCIAWVWPVLSSHGLTRVHCTQQVFEMQADTRDVVTPRRCCHLAFTEAGLYHYFSKAFSKHGDKFKFEHSSKTILSSVVVSDSNDVRNVKVTSKGFNLPVVNIPKGQIVLWSWKESSSDKHNIVYVNPPDHPKCYSSITGPDAFTSGEPQTNSSFAYAFEEPGSFHFTSEGASGSVGTVNVLEAEVCTSMPLIVSKCEGGTVEKWHKIELESNTEGATILYTMDGSTPDFHGATTRVYKKEKAICLKKSGLHIIRARAMSDRMLPSKTFTSARFWVLEGSKGDSSDDEDAVSIATEDFEEEQKLYTSCPTTKWQWWQCVPKIQGWFHREGCVEVYWELPQADNRGQVAGYQLFVDDVCYHTSLPSDCHSILIDGLAGGQTYYVSAVAMPKEPVFLPHQSNRLVVQVPVLADHGGPILSCEIMGEDNSICLVWPTSKIDSKDHKFEVYINDKQHGDQVCVESGADSPKVVIETDEKEEVMKMFVLALPPDGESESDGCISNVLEIPMPLNRDHIQVSDSENVVAIPYLMVKEGSGNPPGADKNLLPSWNSEEDQFNEPITAPSTNTTQLSSTQTHNPGEPDSNSGIPGAASPSIADERTNLPIPIVTAQTNPKNTELHICWQCPVPASKAFALHHFMVNVEGSQFDEHIESHFSKAEFHGYPEGGMILQHSWNLGQNVSFTVNGLCENTSYSVFITAVYCHQDLNQNKIRVHSKHVQCTTGGSPLAPTLQVTSVGCQEVTIGWELRHCHKDIEVEGFILVRNRKAMPDLIPRGISEKTIKNLKPGATYHFSVIMVTSDSRKTKPSNTVTVTCPKLPEALQLNLDDVTRGEAKITWAGIKEKDISAYLVYVDGELHGEVEVTEHNPKSLQYSCKVSTSGQSHKITVMVYAGWRNITTPCKEAVCGIIGPKSNPVLVRPMDVNVPQVKPIPCLEGLHPGGIDISWQIPDQQADICIAGYVILKDGEPVPPLLASNITRSTVPDIKLGSTVMLQVVAFAGPPRSPGSASSDDETNIDDILENYNACEPGPVLQVKYVGLVPPPPRVWSEIVTGHSALIVWEKGKKPRKHYVLAESYVVRWWETQDENADDISESTTDDHLLVTNLKPGTEYTVIVESCRHHKYIPHTVAEDSEPEEERDQLSYTCLVSGESEPLKITTASPPIPPKDLKVSVDYNVARISWQPPVECGVEVIGLRIYATTKIGKLLKTVLTTDLLPDATSITISPLDEATEYAINLVTFTDEFFDQLPANSALHRGRDFPQDWTADIVTDSVWLPVVSTKFTTAGHLPPTNLIVLGVAQGAVAIQWNSPVYASGALQKYEIEWTDEKLKRHSSDISCLGCIEVADNKTDVVLRSLVPGHIYDITVTAVVSREQHCKKKLHPGEDEMMRFSSEVMRFRVPAPTEVPEILLMGYSDGRIDLCWAKPELFTTQRTSDDSCIVSSVRQHLLGYRLEVNGTTHSHLGPNTLSCALTQCQSGKSYDVILVAMTTTDKHLAKKMAGKAAVRLGKLRRLEYDEAQSDVMRIAMPNLQSGNIISLFGKYQPLKRNVSDDDKNLSETERTMYGEVHVEWSLQDCGTASEQGIVEYDISWINVADGSEQAATVSHTMLSYDVPVYKRGCIYDISVQAVKEGHMWQNEDTSPSIRISIPGPPDPPKLCCTSMKSDEFILEWGEPKLYRGVGVRGYQVYMNDKKIGHRLTADHHKAAIPARPDRIYRMSIVAHSEDPTYGDSRPSTQLEIHTPPMIRREDDNMDVTAMWREHNQKKKVRPLPLAEHPENITVGLVDSTDLTIVVEWRLPPAPVGKPAVDRIKVEWSSVAKPEELKMLLKPSTSQYTIRDCIPGTNHFIIVSTLDAHDMVISRSKQLTVQTAALLSTPTLRIKHCNYAGCLLEWDKPTQYGNTRIMGYKLRMNGKSHDELPPKATTYMFTGGKMCKEYRFTLQALANVSTLDSSPSNPLAITWPGVIAPTLQRTPSGKVNTIRVKWKEPLPTGGAKIKYYKLTCHNDSSGKDQHGRPHIMSRSSSPLPVHLTAVEFNHLKPHTNYTITMSIYLEGITKAVRSQPLVTQVAKRPLPPKNLRVIVNGLSERLALEMDTCELINYRDRLLDELLTIIPDDVNAECTTNGYNEENAEAHKGDSVLEELVEVESKLMHNLKEMNAFTGLVYLDLLWDPVPDDGDAKITAYKVVVNGKQHRFLVNSCVTDLRMQLNAYDGIHQISMIAMTKHPVGNSNVSESVTVDLSPFLPYSCYCHSTVHEKGARYPDVGCCAYQHTLSQELSVENRSLRTSVYQRTIMRHTTPASVVVTEMFGGSNSLLVPTKLSSVNPTLILFWTSWCLASQKMMSYFVKYSRSRAEQYVFVTCCCGSRETPGTSHYQSAGQMIVNFGWRSEGTLRHCCCCGTVEAMEEQQQQQQGSGDMLSAELVTRPKSGQSETSSRGDSSTGNAFSIPELFGVQVLPTIVAIHPQGHITWQGCLAAVDSESFNEQFDEVLANVLRDKTSALAAEAAPVSSVKSGLSYRLPSHQVNTSHSKRNLSTNSSTTSHHPRGQRSTKSTLESTRKILSIKKGPYAASARRDERAGSSKKPK